jgi:hypothetical protein
MRVLLAILLGFMATAAHAQPIPISGHGPTAHAQREARTYLASCEALAREHPDRLASCRDAQAMFERLYVRAMAGDLAGQRQVAGEMGAQEPLVAQRNLLQGCAWRMVIVAMHGARADTLDQRMMQATCGQLSPADVERARARASAIGHTILQSPARPLPEPVIVALPPECLDSTARPMTGQLNDLPDPRQKPECRAALARQGRR